MSFKIQTICTVMSKTIVMDIRSAISLLLLLAVQGSFTAPANRNGGTDYPSETREPVDLSDQPFEEGDLYIPKNIGPGRHRMAALDYYSPGKWPNGIIPYVIHEEKFDDREKGMIVDAMNHIMEMTSHAVKFIARSNERECMLVTKSHPGCAGGLGRRPGTYTLVNLQGTNTSHCFTERNLIHHLLHVVGLSHEHMRKDRDDYVTIRWENVKKGRELALDTSYIDYSGYSSYGVKYDYESILHYSKLAHSKDRSSITIQPTRQEFTDIIGRATMMSTGDIQKVQLMYAQKRPRANDW